MLSGKKILLGITGSIAAYKSLQIVRDLTVAGAKVNVVLTKTANRFVPPLTLEVFSGRPVLSDLILIAPITANFIAKMAMGLADDLLSTLLLSTTASSPYSMLSFPERISSMAMVVSLASVCGKEGSM